MARKALGKGLKALIPEPEKTSEAAGLLELSLDAVVPGRYQPRASFDDKSLAELVESIRERGVLQPVVVRKAGSGSYELIAGERRWRAAAAAGLKTIPALVREASPPEALEIALIENIQRSDLNPIETARGYRLLVNEFGLTQEEVARRVGKERPSVSNHLRLLKLPEEIQADVAAGTLSMGHARPLLALPGRSLQLSARRRILSGGLSVRGTERLVKRLLTDSGPSAPTPARDPNLAALEGSLREALGTKVTLRHSNGKGSIEIRYFSLDELQRLCDTLIGRKNG